MSESTTHSHPPLITALLQAERYPHTVDGLYLLETHISWVILTGPYAYKIKKPVDLGFVNFTDLIKRKFYCEEELRLNSRFDTGIYLEVVPITGSLANPQLAGEGEPIEYAVKMVQFPQEVLLSHLVVEHQLKPEQIDQLANEIAQFHQEVAVAGEDSVFGKPERVIEPMRENFRHLFSSTVIEESVNSRLKQLEKWTEAEFLKQRELLLARKQNGFIRECHGDLHLGNMILWKGKVTAFDCIEFNESFRWIDVLSEVAFCVMDLEDRGELGLSHRLLNQYLEATGDYAGITLLPFYLTYRAMVRAKVAAIRFDQPGLTPEERKELKEEFRGYLTLAEKYISRSQPRLMITHGYSGSGKTYGTQSLVEQLGAIRIRSDVERKRLFEREDVELYSPETTDRTYAYLKDLANRILQAGFPVIVDATFLKFSQRDLFASLAKELNIPFSILDFQTPVEEMRRRIVARAAENQDASDADLEVLEIQLASAESFREEELSEVIPVEAGQDDLLSEKLGK
ncbi:MAG: AAA family ATPase [Planctomycetaceae bacterium]